MVIYFKNQKAYEYRTNKAQNDAFIEGCIDAVYTGKRDIDIKYGIESLFLSKREAVSVVFPIESSFINYSDELDFDKKYCDLNNIQYRYQDRKGSTVMAFQGDIYIYDLRLNKDHEPLIHKFIQDVITYLKIRTGKEAVLDGNDILLDNKKIFGMVFQYYPTKYGDYSYMGGILSINSDANVIEKVCYKKSGKIPGSLMEYSITTDEMVEWLLKWFHQHSIQ